MFATQPHSRIAAYPHHEGVTIVRAGAKTVGCATPYKVDDTQRQNYRKFCLF